MRSFPAAATTSAPVARSGRRGVRPPDAIVIGRPVLEIHESDREAIADALAEVLLENTSAERAS